MLIALAVVAAAAFAAYFAGVVEWLACDERSSEACDRQDLATLQFQLALVGLVPAVLLGVAIVTRRRWLTWALLAVAAATYLTWAVLADAAHHGWDDLKFFPFLRR